MEIQYSHTDDKYVVFALIFLLSNQLQAIGDSFFSEVSTKQWFMLLVLNIMEGYSPTLSELSEVAGSSHQNVKQLILKLEQKGYVTLSKDKEDARRLRITLTSKSEELSQAYHEKSAVFMNELFGCFDKEELSITKDVLVKMKTTLERMRKDYVRE